MKSTDLTVDGTPYRLLNAPLSARIEKGTFESDHALIEGRILEPKSWTSVVAFGREGHLVERYQADPRTKGEGRFRFELPLPSLDEPLGAYSAMRFYILDQESRRAYEITDKLDSYYFDVKLNEHNFHLVIQDPASRISDKSSLIYLSRWFLRRYRNEFTLAAPCYCTIGYRLMEARALDELKELASECQYLFATEVDLGGRFNYRWWVSLSLFSGYADLIFRDSAGAARHFQRIIESIPNIAHTPQMVTNTLKAILLQGFIAEEEASGAGVPIWSKAVDALRTATSVWEYENYYSFSELAQSVLLGRECTAGVYLSRQKSDPSDVTVRSFPNQTGVSFSNLGYPANAFGFSAMFPNSGIKIT